MYIVYCHTNRVNGKRYVGWTIVRGEQTYEDAMMHRWNSHCNAANKGAPHLFPRAIHKYGEDAWSHEVIEVMQTRKGVKHAEKLWIAQRRTCAFEPEHHGYNMTHGGDGGGMLGHKLTSAHKEILRQYHLGKPKSVAARKKMSIAKRGKPSTFKGKHHTPEWIKSQSGEKSRLAKLTEVAKLDIITRWENRHTTPVTQHQLAHDNDVTQSTISRLLNGKTWK